MQTVGLTWQHSVEVAAGLAAAGGVMALSPRSRVRNAGAFLRETAVIGVLYGLWRLAGEISQSGVDHAFDRARWIQRVEDYLPLPSEHTVQHAILGHSYVVQAANLYYATMHMTTMLVFLVWLFVRHRDRYRPIRMTMAWTTLACLLIQLTPVAPPRLLAHSGLVDTGLLYNQSVYSNGLAFDQMSAMPSVHVAWAVCVGWYVWRVSSSRWRFVGPVHSVVTVLVVVATGNHWWLDGIVATTLLVLCAWAVHGGRAGVGALVGRWRAARRQPPVDEPEPVPVAPVV